MAQLLKVLKWIFLGLLIVGAAFAGLERLAAERIEVVELIAANDAGEKQITRLWVVDDEGLAYLRVGADGSGWYDRILMNDSVEVVRDGVTAQYRVQARPEKSVRINELMEQKYTWGDTLIAAMIGSREGSIPLELQPL
ncbi:MAG: hypothetical protein O3B02_02275 [Proteobacteria bacterium]|nr:hypothetical protein [Pseudomonadota bacterium]MDA0897059.1 hypothetical protein [Pseudomonadota bacterium]MDA1243812.1 hypothetical protein [Pseudomonadota bacterium]